VGRAWPAITGWRGYGPYTVIMPRNSARDASVVALFDNSMEHALLRQNNAGTSFMICSGSQLHHTYDCGDPARPRSTWCASNWRLRRLRRVPPDGLNDRLFDAPTVSPVRWRCGSRRYGRSRTRARRGGPGASPGSRHTASTPTSSTICCCASPGCGRGSPDG
jgi:hypothetical protein